MCTLYKRTLFDLVFDGGLHSFIQGEVEFIRSLSACMFWLARGGKSGSTFCKTKDDRFILKVPC